MAFEKVNETKNKRSINTKGRSDLTLNIFDCYQVETSFDILFSLFLI